MKYPNLYEITFETKRGYWQKHLIHVEAYNKKEAAELAKSLWYENYEPHMFSINARVVPLDECLDVCHWFVKA